MKDKKIFIILVPILCAVAAIISYLNVINKNEVNDAIKFKEEYESINGQIGKNNKEYKTLNISKNNPIKYSTYNEILDVIKNGTGVIYLGFPECPWCRSALPVLFDVAKDNNVKTIYYLNIFDDRDTYVVSDGKLVYDVDDDNNEKKGTKEYFKLLEALEDNLSDYVITYEGKTYETGEKRIYAPSVIFVKDGKVLDLHVSTVESHKSGYDKMTKEQYDELYEIYEKSILKINKDSCSIGSSC